MPQARWLAALLAGFPLWAAGAGTAPSYSAASIVNSASNKAGVVTPNGLVTIYGTNLAYSTYAVTAAEVALSGSLPTAAAGVRVYIGGAQAFLYYVSPTQINALLPAKLPEGDLELWVFRESTIGEKVKVKVVDAAPALFPTGQQTVIATHADGSLITAENPARAEEIIVLYAVGLGRTVPDVISGCPPTTAIPIRRRSEFRVRVAGEDLEDSMILYAGVAPGFAGLYQVNVRLPATLPANPDIQLAIADQPSAALSLPVAKVE